MPIARAGAALAATFAVALALAPGAARADEPLVLLPPALARPDRAFVAGRVVGERHDGGPTAWRNDRRLAAESWEDAPVEIRFLGRVVRTWSGHDGEFAVELPADPGAPFPPGPQVVEASVPGATARSTVHVVAPEAPFLVVSDLDDTLAVTNVASLRRTIGAGLLEDEATQPPVPGMAAFLRCLREGKAAPPPVAIVSGSPVQLAPRIEAFLARNGFPPAALHLRNLGPRTLSAYKEPVLERLVARFARPLVLVGDSGERDPEIYGALAKAHPGRVLRVYVRAAAGAATPRERLEGMHADGSRALRPRTRSPLTSSGTAPRARPSGPRPRRRAARRRAQRAGPSPPSRSRAGARRRRRAGRDRRRSTAPSPPRGRRAARGRRGRPTRRSACS